MSDDSPGKNSGVRYSINLSFEEIRLPPFQDILVLGKNSKHGKIGVMKSFDFLVPNGFEIIEVQHEKVEAIFVNKRILAKIPKDRIAKVLRNAVFPYVSEGELLKVDFRVAISYLTVEEEW